MGAALGRQLLRDRRRLGRAARGRRGAAGPALFPHAHGAGRRERRPARPRLRARPRPRSRRSSFAGTRAETFDAAFPYGRRPKVELFWRLGVPGDWDRWTDDPWDPPRNPRAPEAGRVGRAGWVARLASGRADLERADRTSFLQRGAERRAAITAALDRRDAALPNPQSDAEGLLCYSAAALGRLAAGAAPDLAAAIRGRGRGGARPRALQRRGQDHPAPEPEPARLLASRALLAPQPLDPRRAALRPARRRARARHATLRARERPLRPHPAAAALRRHDEPRARLAADRRGRLRRPRRATGRGPGSSIRRPR